MSANHAASDAVVLRTEHLGRRVNNVEIVNDISLDVRHGEMLGIVGPSGSGKSSFLRLLNRLDEPTSGTVFLEGQDYRQFSPRELAPPRRDGHATSLPVSRGRGFQRELRTSRNAARPCPTRKSHACWSVLACPDSPRAK